jgi:hypothetical protein
MKSTVKEKWVAALRSGDYKKTKNHLHTSEGFCCLGVLTDLYLKENNLEWDYLDSVDSGSPGQVDIYSFESMEGSLPESVMNWAGITIYPSHEFNNHQCLVVAEMNDRGNSPANFDEIADYIESYV